jgi:hypothetical protein
MICKRIPFVSALLFVFLSFQVSSQPLERSIPEREGVSSKGITEFLDAVSKSKH